MTTKSFMSVQENKIDAWWGNHYRFPYHNSSGELSCSKCWLCKTPTHPGNREGLTPFRAATDPLVFPWMRTFPSTPHASHLCWYPGPFTYTPLLWTTGSLTAMPMSWFFRGFFWTWIIFKAFIEFATILFWLYVLAFWPQGMWDLSCRTRDWTHTPLHGKVKT